MVFLTKYVIALSELGIKNNDIIFLLLEYAHEIEDMFNLSTHIFDTNFELINYVSFFCDKVKVLEALSKAEEILCKNKELGIKTTYYTKDTYPRELAKIDNPPAIIYYKGAEFTEIPCNAIACVGTRKPTKLSYNAANYLIPQWVRENCSIISGLACGVDKISHQSCITAGGKTIAVLAHGLDTIYPKENISLAERILSSGGILMSEYSVGTKPDKYRFVNRNRLIVGMARVVMIYECDEKGGTMHNVDYALRQHKKIFCPALGNEINDVQTGTKKIIEDKLATIIENGRDIKGILAVLDIEDLQPPMKSSEIKKIYLKSILKILKNNEVLDTTIQELKLPLKNDDLFYENALKLINKNVIKIDVLINSIINNNISSINKTIQFND